MLKIVINYFYLISSKLFSHAGFLLFQIYWYFYSSAIRNQKKTSNKPRVLFGTYAIHNNMYWSGAVKEIGIDSKTVVNDYAKNINKKSDFDIYLNEIIAPSTSELGKFFRNLRLIKYLATNYDILHINCQGVSLQPTNCFKEYREAWFFKKAGCKIIVIPYGSDVIQYSRLSDNSVKHALLSCLPQYALYEEEVAKLSSYWIKNADIFYIGFMLEPIGRWDMLLSQGLQVDVENWKHKQEYSGHDGITGTVNIMHSPTYRGVKGTEFLIEAVNNLKREGLKVNLILLENIQNEEVKRIMVEEADILAEHFIFTGSGLNGIEGLASGLPVLANLDNENLTRVYRRYSFLNESPVLSCTPESIEKNLRILVRNPKLREKLGRASRKYAEKYHSYKTYQFIFQNFLDKIWYGKAVNLLDLFHPLNPNSYNNMSEKIEHPLIENKIPEKLFNALNN